MRSTRSIAKGAAPPVASTARPCPWLLWALLAIVALTVHASSFLPFLSDDALISLRYAERLLEGSGLTWTDGPRVEGYSNLLWVLACAALGWIGIDLIDAARALGWLAHVAALLAVLTAARRPSRAIAATAPGGPSAGHLPVVAGTLLLALSGTIAAWTFGGLEQPLVVALLAWTVVGMAPLLEAEPAPGTTAPRSRGWLPASMLALLCWTRPDGPLFTAAVCAGWIAARGMRRGVVASCLRLAALPAVAVALQLGFRLVYYGEWLPNTAYAKLGFSATRLFEGALYLSSGLGSQAPLVLLAGLLVPSALADPRSAARLRFLGALLAIWCAYVVAVGGDIFPAYRQLAPVVVLLCFVAAEGLRGLALRSRRALQFARGVTAVALLAMLPFQWTSPEYARARAERWEWDGEVIGRLLARAFGERRPLLAVDPSGSLPYFSGLPALDMLGLSDHYLAHHPPADFGRGWIGHELGDGDYVMSRQPDLVVFCSPAGGATPCFRSGIELVREPAFHAAYRLTHLEGADPYLFRSRPWARLEGGAIGIERSRDRVAVPAHLLTANPASVARLDAAGELFVEVDVDTPAGIAALLLEPGLWHLAVRTETGQVEVGVTVTSGAAWRVKGATSAVDFEIAGPDSQFVDVGLSSGGEGGPARVRGLVLRRL